MKENTDYTTGIVSDKSVTEPEEKARALAEKWDSVMKAVDPAGYEYQYPQGEEYISMLKDFLLDADEPLALEVLGLQEMVVLDSCDDIPTVVDLLGDIKEFLGDAPIAEELFNSDLPDAMEEEAGKQENGLYRYYSTQRPVDIGTYPKTPGNKPVIIKNFDSRIPTDNGNLLAWGYLEYEKPLTEEQYRSYELKPAFTSGEQTQERVSEKPKEKSVLADLHSRKCEKVKEEHVHKKPDRAKAEIR